MNEFEIFADKVKKWQKKPSDDEFAKLHALYKQSTVGDIKETEKPGDTPLEKKKYEVWNQFKGMKQEDAKKEYIKLSKELTPKYETAESKWSHLSFGHSNKRFSNWFPLNSAGIADFNQKTGIHFLK